MTRSEELAKKFHELYEELAPSFGYETRKESAKPWSEVPEKNKALMIAVCRRIRSDFILEEREQAYDAGQRYLLEKVEKIAKRQKYKDSSKLILELTNEVRRELWPEKDA